MDILGFLLGLLLGLVVWRWQRAHFQAQMRILLQDLYLNGKGSSSPPLSQLSLAIASHHQIRKQLEEQLENYRQVLHMAPIGYLQVDDENRLTWCNLQARELLGITQDQYPRPRLLLEVVRSYELDHLIEQTRNAKVPCQKDWTLYPVSSDPSQLSKQQAYTLRGHGFPLLQGHIGIFLENRQETALLKQQRDRWASDVAHELKTPLTSIRLVAETLQTRLDAPLRSWVDRLIRETVRLSTLVQDLLDLSQMDGGASHCLQLKTTDLVELVHTAWLNLEPLARKKQLRLDYSGPDHLLIQIDEPLLYRVLVNLFDNSIKYSPPWQQIRVQLSLKEEASSAPGNNRPTLPVKQIHLDVIDAGPGFTDNDLPHVFERFYRSDPSRSRSISSGESPIPLPSPGAMDTIEDNQSDEHDQANFQYRSGSGLGLAIVKQIIEAHSGSVMASNHPVTGGAWLKVYLPLQHPEPLLKN